jgi:hypothetical protein
MLIGDRECVFLCRRLGLDLEGYCRCICGRRGKRGYVGKSENAEKIEMTVSI